MTDLNKMPDILPCPFCGNPDVQLVTIPDADGDALHAVGCPKCGCNGTPHVAAMDDPRPAAVVAWNRRALLTAPPGYVLVPVELAGRLQASIGAFVSDEGWGAADMGTADDLSALLAAAPEPEA